MAYAPTEEEPHLEGARAESISTYRNLLADRDRQLDAAKRFQGPDSDRWKRLEEKLRDAEEKCKAIYNRLLRPTDALPIPLWAVACAIFVFGIMEMPVNKFMLDNIIRGNNFDSYILSLFLTLCLLILAHIAGHQTRQVRGSYHETIYWGNIASAVAILVFLAICVGALTIGRAYFSVAMPSPMPSDIFSKVVSEVQKVGPITAFLSALSDNSAFFLACFNTAGIALAFFAAFISCDSDRNYQSALTSAAAVERKLTRMTRRYNTRIEKITTKFGTKLAIVAAAYSTQNAKIIALKRGRSRPLNGEDAFDLTSLDTSLTESRNNIVRDSPAVSPADEDLFGRAAKYGGNSNASPADHERN
jgi:hypothetical protein